MATSHTTQMSAAVRKYARAMGVQHKLAISYVGSFIALRIEDAEGTLGVKAAQQIVYEASRVIADAGIKRRSPNTNFGYHMHGIVCTWELA